MSAEMFFHALGEPFVPATGLEIGSNIESEISIVPELFSCLLQSELTLKLRRAVGPDSRHQGAEHSAARRDECDKYDLIHRRVRSGAPARKSWSLQRAIMSRPRIPFDILAHHLCALPHLVPGGIDVWPRASVRQVQRRAELLDEPSFDVAEDNRGVMGHPGTEFQLR